ncbi:MAG: DUF5667 domain-containing protein [Chloroflexi bacterium]|nr:DUF5667 domain-containing protein [Chloroflexota bacterium]
MANQLEEIFNDCFERLLSGESLDSCLSRYPQYAAELDQMLKMAFDIKRRAYPIQPRPEFKYWARVRMHGVQDYVSRQPVELKPSIFHWRRSWAVALSAVMVFVLVTGGTAAASSEAMPDQPLYGVKMAVEQAQVALTFSDMDKAELHAQLAEKRAQEIAVMANQGKTDKIVTTMTNLNRHLEDLETSLQRAETVNAGKAGFTATETLPPAATTPSIVTPQTTTSPTITVPPVVTPQTTTPSATTVAPVVTPQVTTPAGKIATDNLSADTQSSQQQLPKTGINAAKVALDVNKARSINTNTAKSITVLQNALKNAPDSVKPALRAAIERARKANERIQLPSTGSVSPKSTLPNINPNKGAVNTTTNDAQQSTDKPNPFRLPDKPKLIPSIVKSFTSSGTVKDTGNTDNTIR